MTTFEKIHMQEEIDRYVTSSIFTDLFSTKGYTVSSTDTPIKCAVDLECTLTNPNSDKVLYFNAEIKERNKSELDLMKYGYCIELREKKLHRMLNYSYGKTVIYVSLFTNTTTGEKTAYLFNLNGIDWNNTEKFDWRIKATQMDANSGYVIEPTYKIPISKAFIKVPLKEYYDNLPENLQEYKRILE